MAGPKQWTEEIIAQRFAEGRGAGTRETYSPWLSVQEFSSRGTQTRVPSVKFKRTVHTFSYIERALFLLAEFQQDFHDFNEQRPMDRAVTLGCAKALGIRHPRYPKTAVPVVMTLDALVTTVDANGVPTVAAWDVKPSARLKDRRVLEKLSLHRGYCAHTGIAHYLFTETTVSRDVIRNIEFVRASLQRPGEIEVTQGMFTWRLDEFLEGIFTCRTRPTVSHFCAQYDRANAVEPGTGLRLFKQLVWRRRLNVDLEAVWLEREPIPRRGESAVRRLPLLRSAA